MRTSRRIRSGFNFFASSYDFFSRLFFGNSILHSQTFLLPELKKCKSILVFGGGTGRLLVELIQRDMAGHYSYVDISDKMISISRKRLEQSIPEKKHLPQFICGSVNEIPVDQKFDLIITPYVLDCFGGEDLTEIMRQLDAHLTPNGTWLFTDFNIPGKGLNKSFSLLRIRAMYFAFNVICGLGIKRLPDFKNEFEKLNYTITAENYFLHGMIAARIYKKGNRD